MIIENEGCFALYLKQYLSLSFFVRMVGNFQEIDHGIDSPLAGLGYGLPISRSYCRYFGVSTVLLPLRAITQECRDRSPVSLSSAGMTSV
jgi:hypothetical protein